ncbi:hypothetical protein HPSH417_05285 [Helicobacter pylori Shi417]|uniref:Uncharacterized protein n=1 Tax=Helicobacter pylori Shi169 TaxID=1163741 RepID=A0A0E0WDC3_HELPX|nr:hypothetical protein HPSH_05740 [Helicobacter pylori Shi470]AFH98189.1 hypothetical protein HPSH417_05285 [Helicobacter pylori Shi417]AFH99768.1 hypothetical protein HPSH169_05510 [Helicobacter pylori Shi169]
MTLKLGLDSRIFCFMLSSVFFEQLI